MYNNMFGNFFDQLQWGNNGMQMPGYMGGGIPDVGYYQQPMQQPMQQSGRYGLPNPGAQQPVGMQGVVPPYFENPDFYSPERHLGYQPMSYQPMSYQQPTSYQQPMTQGRIGQFQNNNMNSMGQYRMF